MADSGPGRTCKKLLARLHHMGFIYTLEYQILPPSLKRRTVTTGRSRPSSSLTWTKSFKSGSLQKESTSLPPWICGLVVFGGKDPTSGYVLTNDKCAFTVGFSREACINAWETVGAAPLTMKCLDNKKVRRELGDAEDSLNARMVAIQEANDTATAFLSCSGYVAQHLKVQINEVAEPAPITQLHTQERTELLTKTNSHGVRHTVAAGLHLTSDDFFKRMKILAREAEVAEM